MENIKLDLTHLSKFVKQDEISSLQAEFKKINDNINNKVGEGNDFLGWATLPSEINDKLLADIKSTADRLKSMSELVVVIGIGGSYLGARAVIDALSNSFSSFAAKTGSPFVVYAGNSLSEDYHKDLLKLLDRHEYSVVVISKSGTTTEPAIAFRLIRQHLYDKYGKESASKRIVAITDKEKGALKTLADAESYKTFVIPDDVGGRYSVLTPVGLLPIACAGFDVGMLVRGAKDMLLACSDNADLNSNIIAQYAAIRNVLCAKGNKIEVLVAYNPKFMFMVEWWKQLYGESEGKDGKGIFPAGMIFTTDLHSLGQYMQDGERMLFETVISVKDAERGIIVPKVDSDIDKLNYIAGKTMEFVNKKAELGTIMAHVDGGVPVIRIEIPALNEYYIGQLIYFFERACALSGYLLGVNPFDQPGVEAYKKNMFKLLKEG